MRAIRRRLRRAQTWVDHHARRLMLSGTTLLVGLTFLTLVVVGAIVGLATGSWWALVAAVVVHGLATMVLLIVLAPW